MPLEPNEHAVSYRWCDIDGRHISLEEYAGIRLLWTALDEQTRMHLTYEFNKFRTGRPQLDEVPDVCGSCFMDAASLVQQRKGQRA